MLQGKGQLGQTVTHHRHLGGISDQNTIFHQTIKKDAGAGIDENTVNLEQEMTLMMAENTILYMAVNQFLDGRFESWERAIDEGR
jgi:flagellar basal body rod protein FlgB